MPSTINCPPPSWPANETGKTRDAFSGTPAIIGSIPIFQRTFTTRNTSPQSVKRQTRHLLNPLGALRGWFILNGFDRFVEPSTLNVCFHFAPAGPSPRVIRERHTTRLNISQSREKVRSAIRYLDPTPYLAV